MKEGKNKKEHLILTINPGGTTTRISLFKGEKEIWKKKIEHDKKEISACPDLMSQYPLRREAVLNAVKEAEDLFSGLDAVVGRGACLKPLPGGTYRVNSAMLSDLKNLRLQSPHISFVAGILAHEIGEKYGCPAYITDPISVDEFLPPARLSGHPAMPRKSLWHALNCRSAAHRAAKKLNKKYNDVNLVVAHLGSGITVSAHEKGRAIDTTNANSEAPFGPERCGTLPTLELLEWFTTQGMSLESAHGVLTREGGIYAHLSISDCRQVEKRIDEGDEHAALVFDAMAYQVGKSIGAYSAALSGKVDAIVLTGALAFSKRLVSRIRKMVKFIAQVIVIPGENEMEALAQGGLRVLIGAEKEKIYKQEG